MGKNVPTCYAYIYIKFYTMYMEYLECACYAEL